jgi:hypothetical protein
MGIVATLLLLIAKHDIHINATRNLTSVSYLSLMNPLLYLLSTTCAHPCYFPHTPVCSKVLLRRRIKEQWSFLKSVSSAWHTEPPISRRLEEWSHSRNLAAVPRYSDSCKCLYSMFPALYKHCFDISIMLLYVWTS